MSALKCNNSRYRIKLACNLEQLRKLKIDWLDLEHRSRHDNTFFQSFSWCENWASAYLNEDTDKSIRIFSVWSDDSLIFLLPLFSHSRVAGANEYGFLSQPAGEYGNVLCDPDHNPAELFQICLDAIIQSGDSHILRLEKITRSQAWIFEQKEITRPVVTDCAHILDLSQFGSWNDYQQSLPNKSNKRIRKKQRLLAASSKLHSRIVPANSSAYKSAVMQMLVWKDIRLRARGIMSASIGTQQFSELLRDYPADLADSNYSLFCHLLCVDDIPVAGQIVLRQGACLYSYFTAFDPTVAEFSPGRLELHLLIKWMIENGYKRFDFLGHPEDYKIRASNSSNELVNIELPLNLKGRIVATSNISKLKPAIKGAFYALPRPLRQKITARLPGHS